MSFLGYIYYKNNLHLSFVGMREYTDLARAESLIRRAEEIDPDFCNVNYQWAFLLFHRLRDSSIIDNELQNKFEDKLTESVLCASTSAHAFDLFNRYWSIMTQNGKDKDALLRYQSARNKVETFRNSWNTKAQVP